MLSVLGGREQPRHPVFWQRAEDRGLCRTEQVHPAHRGLFPLLPFFATQSKQSGPCPIWLMIWEINPPAITAGHRLARDRWPDEIPRVVFTCRGGSRGKGARARGLCSSPLAGEAAGGVTRDTPRAGVGFSQPP